MRVLCYWRDRVSKPLDLLVPRPRRQPARAARSRSRVQLLHDAEAADVALESLNKKQDSFLKYTLDETMKTLDRFTRVR